MIIYMCIPLNTCHIDVMLYILQMDYPHSPGSKGAQMFLHQISDEMRQEYRQKIFRASKADVINVAMRSVVTQPH